ncbi:hypothetical protein I302_105543 [Kwoniella bestiolae CBS 10118]|uniref:Uncharacterized protein n=1 Tax=Kwoniella bestiolae CBS 10118 TaxID=1296100 RepID=A0A1B9FTE3_9TREE|nr:hypothetical protein I302_08826 [Kwoniella bestiolae CBS 10118]OCF22045.1 hypothetical protein I302_08826 [Kwoniella bestiolae CBS 10118]
MLFSLSLLPLLSLCSAHQTAKLRLSGTTPEQCLSQVMTNAGKSPTVMVHLASCHEARAWSFFDGEELPGKMEYQSGAGLVLVAGEGDKEGTVVELQLGYDGFAGQRCDESSFALLPAMRNHTFLSIFFLSSFVIQMYEHQIDVLSLSCLGGTAPTTVGSLSWQRTNSA